MTDNWISTCSICGENWEDCDCDEEEIPTCPNCGGDLDSWDEKHGIEVSCSKVQTSKTF